MGQAVQVYTSDALGDLDAVVWPSASRPGEIAAPRPSRRPSNTSARPTPSSTPCQFEAYDGHTPRPGPCGRRPIGLCRRASISRTTTTWPACRPATVRPRDAPPGEEDLPCAEQFLAQGYVVLGKSTLPEFGLTATTEFVDRPPTRNPWNTDHSAGASSASSAALVASGGADRARQRRWRLDPRHGRGVRLGRPEDHSSPIARQARRPDAAGEPRRRGRGDPHRADAAHHLRGDGADAPQPPVDARRLGRGAGDATAAHLPRGHCHPPHAALARRRQAQSARTPPSCSLGWAPTSTR